MNKIYFILFLIFFSIRRCSFFQKCFANQNTPFKIGSILIGLDTIRIFLRSIYIYNLYNLYGEKIFESVACSQYLPKYKVLWNDSFGAFLHFYYDKNDTSALPEKDNEIKIIFFYPMHKKPPVHKHISEQSFTEAIKILFCGPTTVIGILMAIIAFKKPQ